MLCSGFRLSMKRTEFSLVRALIPNSSVIAHKCHFSLWPSVFIVKEGIAQGHLIESITKNFDFTMVVP